MDNGYSDNLDFNWRRRHRDTGRATQHYSTNLPTRSYFS